MVNYKEFLVFVSFSLKLRGFFLEYYKLEYQLPSLSKNVSALWGFPSNIFLEEYMAMLSGLIVNFFPNFNFLIRLFHAIFMFISLTWFSKFNFSLVKILNISNN